MGIGNMRSKPKREEGREGPLVNTYPSSNFKEKGRTILGGQKGEAGECRTPRKGMKESWVFRGSSRSVTGRNTSNFLFSQKNSLRRLRKNERGNRTKREGVLGKGLLLSKRSNF